MGGGIFPCQHRNYEGVVRCIEGFLLMEISNESYTYLYKIIPDLEQLRKMQFLPKISNH